MAKYLVQVTDNVSGQAEQRIVDEDRALELYMHCLVNIPDVGIETGADGSVFLWNENGSMNIRPLDDDPEDYDDFDADEREE